MIVDLQSISRSTRHFDLTYQSDWWRNSEGDAQVHGLEGPLVAKISISREDKEYHINGRLTGRLRLVCDRCLETYTFRIGRDFRLSLSLPVPAESVRDETELKENDLAVRFISTEEVDLDDIIREQIYLSLPMKLLCDNGCVGLCARCGVNLNIETCQCHESGGHPAFLKLKDLKVE